MKTLLIDNPMSGLDGMFGLLAPLPRREPERRRRPAPALAGRSVPQYDAGAQQPTEKPRSPGVAEASRLSSNSSPSQAQWAECVRRIAEQRDRASFMQLFDHFAPRVNSYLRQQGANESLAEDLCQEILLTVWRKAGQYDPSKAAVSTWLFRIARNRMIDHLRRERGIAYDSEDDAAADLVSDEDVSLNVDGSRIRELVSDLPPQQVEAVYKSYFEGKSHGEIAAETGMPLGTVKSNLRRAVLSLRRQLGVEVT